MVDCVINSNRQNQYVSYYEIYLGGEEENNAEWFFYEAGYLLLVLLLC